MKKILFLLCIYSLFLYPMGSHEKISDTNQQTEDTAQQDAKKEQERKAEDAILKRTYDRLKQPSASTETNASYSQTTNLKPESTSSNSDNFNLDHFSEEMNLLKNRRAAEDIAQKKMVEAENRIAIQRRKEQELGERAFSKTSSDQGIDKEEQLALNKQILETNKTRLFEDLTLKARHFDAFKDKYQNFSGKAPWNVILKLGDMPTFMNDSLEGRATFLEQIKGIIDGDIKIEDEDIKPLQDLLKLTQLHTTGTTKTPGIFDKILQQDLNSKTSRDKASIKKTLQDFIKQTVQKSYDDLNTFNNNLERIKEDLVTKLAAIKNIKTAANNATMVLGGVAVSCLVHSVDSVVATMHMTMETFGLLAKGAFLVAHGTEHVEMDQIRQLQDSFVETFQALLPETTQLIKSIEYKSSATGQGTRTTHALRFKSTELTETLMDAKNVDSPKFNEDLEDLKKEIQSSIKALRGKRIDQLLEIVNENPDSPAAEKIIEMLQETVGENNTLKKSEDGTWSYTSSLSQKTAAVAHIAHSATSFKSTLLAEDLMSMTINDQNFKTKLDALKTELENSNKLLRSQRIKSLLDVINKEPENSATKEIIKKLNESSILDPNDTLRKNNDGQWVLTTVKSKGIITKLLNLQEKSPDLEKTLNELKKSLQDLSPDVRKQQIENLLNQLASNANKEAIIKSLNEATISTGIFGKILGTPQEPLLGNDTIRNNTLVVSDIAQAANQFITSNNPTKAQEYLNTIKISLAQESEAVRAGKIKILLDIINERPYSYASKKIIEMLSSEKISINGEEKPILENFILKQENSKWILTSKLAEKAQETWVNPVKLFGKRTLSKLYDFVFKSKTAQQDIFEEFKLATEKPGLTDAQIEANYKKELKRIELERARQDLANYRNSKASGTITDLDFKEFEMADALLKLERESEDAFRIEFWKNKDKNYDAIRNERKKSESFIKELLTDTAADHERTAIRDRYRLETNIARMHEDFEIKKQRFDSFAKTYPDFSKKAPWQKLLALNDMNEFINMSYEQRSSLLNELDTVIGEFLKSPNIDNDLKALEDFMTLNSRYLGKLPKEIQDALKQDISNINTENFKDIAQKFLKEAIQASLTTLRTFNEDMKDIQGEIKSLKAMNKVKNTAYSAVMLSGAVGVAAFLTHAHVVFEAAAVVGKISLIVSHIYTEKAAHLEQQIQDRYVDMFSTLLPESTKLIKTQIHINRGKQVLEFASTRLVKDLMTMDPQDPNFKEKLNDLQKNLFKRKTEWYRSKRIESLLEIINADPESSSAKEIINLLNGEFKINDKTLLSNHNIEMENGKWVLTSSKSQTLLNEFLRLGDTNKQDAQLTKLKSTIQDEMSTLSAEVRKKRIKQILNILNTKLGDLSDVSNRSYTIPKIIDFLNTATDKPTSLITKASKAISNFFNSTEAAPERLIIGNDKIEPSGDTWTLEKTQSAKDLEELLGKNTQDPNFQTTLKSLTQELQQEKIPSKEDKNLFAENPNLFADRVTSLLDIVNKTPNSPAAEAFVQRFNTDSNLSQDYSIEQENGKWVLVAKKSIIITENILKIKDPKTTDHTKISQGLTDLKNELRKLSPELRKKRIENILDIINTTKNKNIDQEIVSALNRSILPDYQIVTTEGNLYQLQPVPQYTDAINKANDTISNMINNSKEINDANLKNFNNQLEELPKTLLTEQIKNILQKITDSLENQKLSPQNAIKITKSLNLGVLEKSDLLIAARNGKLALVPKNTSRLSMSPTNDTATPDLPANTSTTASM